MLSNYVTRELDISICISLLVTSQMCVIVFIFLHTTFKKEREVTIVKQTKMYCGK